MRKAGLAIDVLRSCDVVTADGEFVVASEVENPYLFWGLRGGGGNFGVVTSFEFELCPLGPTVLAGMLAWPMEQAPQILGFLRDFIAMAPDEIGIMANLRLAPPLPMIPENLRGKPIVALVVCYAGPVERGERVLDPLRRGLPTPVVDTVVPKPYVRHQKMFDPALPHGRNYYWRSHKLDPLTDPVIEVIIEHCSMITSPLSTVARDHRRGPPTRDQPPAPLSRSGCAHHPAPAMRARPHSLPRCRTVVPPTPAVAEWGGRLRHWRCSRACWGSSRCSLRSSPTIRW